MLIICKKSEKDYYDGVVGTMGVDKTIVYNREIIEMREKDKGFPDFVERKSYYWRKSKNSPFINIAYHGINDEHRNKYQYYGYFIVGFCGKLYIGWKLYSEKKEWSSTKLITTITYDFNLMKSIIASRSYWGNLEDDVNYIKNFDAIQYFRNYKTPIFVYDGDFNRISLEKYSHSNDCRFIINANLSDYEFYKVFDAFQAFQEIQMFLGGVLGCNEKETVEIEDKYRIAQYGFDKWSFRKEPENAKKNS